MKLFSNIKFLVMGLAAFGLLGFGGTMIDNAALNTTSALAPTSFTTYIGGTGGQPIGYLTVMDQTGTADDPTRYINFTTPGTIYQGYRSYFVPGSIALANISGLQVNVNYKGLAAASQTWSWYFYDWAGKQWIKLGDNTPALTDHWTLLTFNATLPLRFINSSTHEIRLLFYPNNASGDARLDYESVSVGYNPPATATRTKTPTPTITRTPNPTPSAVHFAVIGDYGSNNANEAAVATLVKSWNPNFVVTVGDNNYPAGESATIDQNIGQYYHEYIYPYSGSYGTGSAYNRFFPALGNHDWASTTGANPYLTYFILPNNRRYYDFGRGPVHFFIVDSDPHEPDGTSSTSVQAIWLQNRLAAATEPWKIVYMHHAPYSSALHGSTAYMQWNFQAWGADAVIAGHDHTYERIDVSGFPYFVDGLGGQTLYNFGTPVAGSQVRYNAQYGAMLVDANAAQITFKFIDINGMVADTFSLP